MNEEIELKTHTAIRLLFENHAHRPVAVTFRSRGSLVLSRFKLVHSLFFNLANALPIGIYLPDHPGILFYRYTNSESGQLEHLFAIVAPVEELGLDRELIEFVDDGDLSHWRINDGYWHFLNYTAPSVQGPLNNH